MSGPVFMYRKGEAKLFASPEEIPADEGWQDTPVPEDAAPVDEAEPAPKRKRAPKEAESE